MSIKIPPVVVFLVSLGLMFGAYFIAPGWAFDFMFRITLSRVFLVMGVLTSFSGVMAFRMHHTTVDPLHPEKASSLVTRGIYKYTRNPMYVGMAAILIGAAIRLGHPISVLFVGLFIGFIDRFQIVPEEKALQKIFGDAYTRYCEQVGRWI